MSLFVAIKRYILAHWRGEQGLGWSFLVNLVGFRIAIFAAQEMTRPAPYQDYHEWAPMVLILTFLLHGVVFVWQAVGVIRAGEALIRHHGAIGLHWGAQLGVLIAFWFTASYALNAWQMTQDVSGEGNLAERLDSERAARYRLSAEPGGVFLIEGSLELGITKRLDAALMNDIGIREIILSSEGGNIYEARGLARLFRDRGLSTTVIDECSSACTTAFIGGVERTLKTGARLGFHQYRVEADYDVLGADPRGEETRDKSLFLEVGIKQNFVARMHSATPGSMWYPDAAELLEAGVITTIAD